MSPHPSWKSIDSREDLESLDRLVVADESHVLEVYASALGQPFFPRDVCRDGYERLHWRLVLQSFAPNAAFVEVVFVACDVLEWSWLQGPHFDGTVDSLRRVELYGSSQSTQVRCCRLIYRTHSDAIGRHPGILATELAAVGQAI